MATNGLSLHIGLNSVDPNHYAGWSGDLVACEADALDMQAIATRAGHSTTKLLTHDATRDAVRAEINKAAAALTAGDLFFLSYSGHGGQLPDKNDDEPDLNDETWCLYDGQIVDDELYLLYTHFKPGVRILVVSDSCHSGSVIRDMERIARAAGIDVLTNRSTDVGEKLRFRTMRPDLALRVYRENQDEYDAYLEKLPKEKDTAEALKARVRLLSGCQDTQLSLDGAFNGLFTGTLLRVWKEGAFAGDYDRFHRAIAERMPPTQTPNHMVIGPADPAFDAAKPFQI